MHKKVSNIYFVESKIADNHHHIGTLAKDHLDAIIEHDTMIRKTYEW